MKYFTVSTQIAVCSLNDLYYRYRLNKTKLNIPKKFIRQFIISQIAFTIAMLIRQEKYKSFQYHVTVSN
jgi:hypothetical protein